MQRAWIAYRDTTCGSYDDKIRDLMAFSVQYVGDGGASDIAHFLQRAQPGTRAAGAAVQAMRREAEPVLYRSALPFGSDRLK
jgi:hypothetical protein